MANSTRRNKIHPSKVRIRAKKMRHYYGYCVPDTGEVYYRSSLKGRPLLGTIIHELAHVILPEMSERGVEDITRMMTFHLWRMGYRLDETQARR